MTFSILTLFFLNALLFGFGSGLKVDVPYSFRVPSEMGSASPSTGNCCPHVELHENSTHGMVRPLVIGLGTQKGGSSSLYSYLLENPFFEGPKTKELDYLSSGDPNYTFSMYLKKWKSNASRYKKANGGTENLEVLEVANFDIRLRSEVSPNYLMLPYSPCRAKRHFPEAKFVVFLREPVSRILSSYQYTVWMYRQYSNATYPSWKTQGILGVVKNGLEKLKSDQKCDFANGRDNKSFNDCIGCLTVFHDALTECELRPMAVRTGPNGKFECFPFVKELILRSLYGPQLSRWFEFFPPDQFFIVNSDQFFEEPASVMTKVIDFLGVSQEFTEEMVKEDINSNYHEYDWKLNPESVSEAKALLQEFFKRPNLELYRLLEEAGHGDFMPFEEKLKGIKTLNCSSPLFEGLGVCPKSIEVKYAKLPDGLATIVSRRFARWTGSLNRNYAWGPDNKSHLILALLVLSVMILANGYRLRCRHIC